MRIIACLAHYDERPDWIERYVEGLALAGATHLVAVDGAYAEFPQARPHSEPYVGGIMAESCKAHGVHLTTFTPSTTWKGGEVEKRQCLYSIAQEDAQLGTDFLLPLDADEWVVAKTIDLQEHLAQTKYDVLTVTLVRRDSYDFRSPDDMVEEQRRVWRTAEGLTVHGKHWIVRTGDGRNYWTPWTDVKTEASGLTVDHMTQHRDVERRNRSGDYYQHRDTIGLETQPKYPG